MILQSDAPDRIARELVETRFKEGNVPSLWARRGEVFRWDGGRWLAEDEEWLRQEIWRALEGAEVQVPRKNGGLQYVPVGLTRGKVGDIASAIVAYRQGPWDRLPWKEGQDPGMWIVLRDGYFDVGEACRGAGGTWRECGPEVVSLGRVPLRVGDLEGATCPVWEEHLEKWFADRVVAETYEELFGYALMTHRRHAVAGLQYGPPRSGKGTGTNMVLQRLLPPPASHGLKMTDLVGGFGLDGCQTASVIVLSEAEELGSAEGRKAVSILKTMLGEDMTTVNVKHLRQLKYMRLRCLPILQCNEMPRLPDAGRGLVTKLVPIHFPFSNLGKEDKGLGERLGKELPGILRRLVEAAVRLEARGWFRESEDGRRIVGKFEMQNNPLMAFLNAKFEKDEGRLVSVETVVAAREKWETENDAVLLNRAKRRVADSYLAKLVTEESSWGLSRVRKQDDHGDRVYIRGMKLRLRRPGAPEDHVE